MGQAGRSMSTMQWNATIAIVCKPQSQSEVCQFCSFQPLISNKHVGLWRDSLSPADHGEPSSAICTANLFSLLKSSRTSTRRSEIDRSFHSLLLEIFYLYYTFFSTCCTAAIAGRRRCVMWFLFFVSPHAVTEGHEVFPDSCGLHWVVLPVQRRHHTYYFDGLVAYKQLGTCDAHGAFVLVDY